MEEKQVNDKEKDPVSALRNYREKRDTDATDGSRVLRWDANYGVNDKNPISQEHRL